MKGRKNPNAGRKTFDGKDEKDVIAKLEMTAALDASVEEMCYYADISRDSFYRYLKKHPEFRDKLDKLRQKPVLKARQTVMKRLEESYSNAMDYLKRKRKEEFGDSTDLTSGGKPINLTFDSAFDETTQKTKRNSK